ncbi:MAG TPA: TetR/AcrR family transcriptional regulator, partial [Trebonia sp.]|nr:TetR/AcrR family transcriptional regulator [Trebonia sp.]
LAEIDSFMLVGMVESAISRWLDSPGGVTREMLARHLSRSIWVLLDRGLRDARVELDPDAPLASPDLS